MTVKLPIETENPLFGLYLYPGAKDIMEYQQDISWTAQEIPVDKDIHDYRHEMNEQQLNLATITLQLFVEIEQKVGEVWEQISSWYPHSEIEGCCAEIARMEKSVHAFFYQKMSDVLNINPEDIAKNQETIKVLKSKLVFLQNITSNLSENKVLSLATVAMIEQVLLFSNFAMLKSFQSNGHNLIKNTITGVDFVVQDEQLHGDFASYLFKTVLAEDKKIGSINKEQLFTDINNIIEEIIEHEDDIIDYTFSGDIAINDITGAQLKLFIRSRANDTLTLLGYEPKYVIDANPIGVWFHRGSKSIKTHDFFAGITNQYRRSWKTDSFSRLPHISGEDNEQH
jgi:ribonucleoside-diphosphate reductase beta chain